MEGEGDVPVGAIEVAEQGKVVSAAGVSSGGDGEKKVRSGWWRVRQVPAASGVVEKGPDDAEGSSESGRESEDVPGEAVNTEAGREGEGDDIPFDEEEAGDGEDGQSEQEELDFGGDQEAAEAELDAEDLDAAVGDGAGGRAGAAEAAGGRPDPRTQGLSAEADARVSEALRVGLAGVEQQLSQVAGVLEGHSAVVKQVDAALQEEKPGAEDGETAKALGQMSASVDQTMSAMVAAVERQSEAFAGVNTSIDMVKEVGKGISRVIDALGACQADLSRQRELEGAARRWTLLVAVALGGPALLVAGAFVEQRWEVLPIEDASGGWKDHVWEHYGGDVVGCVRRALRDGSSFECVIDVSGSVTKVRESRSGR